MKGWPEKVVLEAQKKERRRSMAESIGLTLQIAFTGLLSSWLVISIFILLAKVLSAVFPHQRS
jgi:hypothetical protein